MLNYDLKLRLFVHNKAADGSWHHGVRYKLYKNALEIATYTYS